MKCLRAESLQFAGTNLKRDLTSITTSNMQIQEILSTFEKASQMSWLSVRIPSQSEAFLHVLSNCTCESKGNMETNITVSRQLLCEPGVQKCFVLQHGAERRMRIKFLEPPALHSIHEVFRIGTFLGQTIRETVLSPNM